MAGKTLTVVRQITYRGTEEQLKMQMERSLKDGRYPSWVTDVTVETISTDGITGEAFTGWWQTP